MVQRGVSWRVGFELVPEKFHLVPKTDREGDREGREPEHEQGTSEGRGRRSEAVPTRQRGAGPARAVGLRHPGLCETIRRHLPPLPG